MVWRVEAVIRITLHDQWRRLNRSPISQKRVGLTHESREVE